MLVAFAFPPAGYIAHSRRRTGRRFRRATPRRRHRRRRSSAPRSGRSCVAGASVRLDPATAAGFGVGLAAGAALVDYGTTLIASSLMGAIVRARRRAWPKEPCSRRVKRMLLWTVATAALWAIGWAVPRPRGISVDEQWVVFGVYRRAHLPVPAEHDRQDVHPGRGGDVMGASMHVVFGTGPAGRAVADRTRPPRYPAPGWSTAAAARCSTGVETIGGDVTDPAFAQDGRRRRRAPCTSASTPPTTTAGPKSSRHCKKRSSTPPRRRRPSSSCSRTCTCTAPPRGAPMTRPPRSTRRARRAGRAPRCPPSSSTPTNAARSRSSSVGPADFIGPGVRDSAMGEFVFGPALDGKKAQTMGRPDTLHTYSYVPDIGRNLVLLGHTTMPTAESGTFPTRRPAPPGA